MAFKPFTINDGIVTDGVQGGSVHVEPGAYLVEIDGAAPSPEPEDEDKNSFIDWRLKVIDGPDGVGRRLRHMTVMSDKTMFQLGNLIHFSGKVEVAQFLAKKAQTITTYQEFAAFVPVILKAMRGKRLGVVVADDSYQGNPTSKIVEMFFAADYEAAPADVEELEPDLDDLDEETPPASPKRAATGKSKPVPLAKKTPPAKSLEDELSEYFK